MARFVIIPYDKEAKETFKTIRNSRCPMNKERTTYEKCKSNECGWLVKSVNSGCPCQDSIIVCRYRKKV